MTSYHAVHVVTLSFDDGFASSSLRTAEIFERHGLVAELNVVATGHHTEPDDAWHQGWRKGDFSLWNELKRRGHHVMPHGTVTRTRRNCRSRMHSG